MRENEENIDEKKNLLHRVSTRLIEESSIHSMQLHLKLFGLTTSRRRLCVGMGIGKGVK